MTKRIKDPKCVRKVNGRGLMTIPSRFHEALDLDEKTGGYLRIVRTGPKEIRITPDGREDWWADRRVGQSKPKGTSKMEAMQGAEGFVAEYLAYDGSGRVSVQRVHDLYRAWIGLQGGEMPEVNRAYLGRAIKKMLPDVGRSRAIDHRTGELCSVYLNITIMKWPGGDQEAPEEQDLGRSPAPRENPPAGAAETNPPDAAGAGDDGDDLLDVGGDETPTVITDDQLEG